MRKKTELGACILKLFCLSESDPFAKEHMIASVFLCLSEAIRFSCLGTGLASAIPRGRAGPRRFTTSTKLQQQKREGSPGLQAPTAMTLDGTRVPRGQPSLGNANLSTERNTVTQASGIPS